MHHAYLILLRSIFMVSPTKQTWTVRDRKKVKQGRKRKDTLANHGTTKSREELFKVVK